MGESFASLLRRRREQHGLAQKALARAVGLSPSMITLLEQGERRPTRDQILRISRALELPSDETDELLVAGGQLPAAYDRTPPSDPELAVLADILGDPAIPEHEKLRLRLLIRLECQRWRPRIVDVRRVWTEAAKRSPEGSVPKQAGVADQM